MEKLYELERCTKADDNINQQFILGVKASLESYPLQKQLEVLMEAIRLTSPQFDVNELSNCLYSTAEVSPAGVPLRKSAQIDYNRLAHLSSNESAGSPLWSAGRNTGHPATPAAGG